MKYINGMVVSSLQNLPPDKLPSFIQTAQNQVIVIKIEIESVCEHTHISGLGIILKTHISVKLYKS